MRASTHPNTSEEIQHQDPFEKGYAFEDHVISLFETRKFKLLQRHNDRKASDDLYLLSNSDPDMEFLYLGSKNHRFAVECKWREKFKEGRMVWASGHQICMYEKFQNQTGLPVFIILGVGGEPSKPERVYLAPLKEISTSSTVTETELIPFLRENGKHFTYDPAQSRLF